MLDIFFSRLSFLFLPLWETAQYRLKYCQYFLFSEGWPGAARCWVNFHCRGVLLIWILGRQRPFALAVGAGGVSEHFFSRLSFLFSFSLSGRRPDID